MLRKVFLVAALAACVLAIAAQGAVARGSHGRGVLTNPAGARAEFNYEVAQILRGQVSRLQGRFSFAGPVPEGAGRVNISLRQLAHLSVDGSVCEFGGPAVMLVRRGSQLHEVRGHLRARAHDRRNREHPHGEPDLLALSFSREEEVLYTFRGAVGPGDLTVFVRRVR